MPRRKKDTGPAIPGMGPAPTPQPKASAPQSVSQSVTKAKAAPEPPAPAPAPVVEEPPAPKVEPTPTPAPVSPPAPKAQAAPPAAKAQAAAPKAKSEPKAKAKAEPKAEPKAKSEPKAKAKAESKAAPSQGVAAGQGQAKAKAKADAKAKAAPAPVPEPAADFGMEAVKKRRRRKKADEVETLEETEDAADTAGPWAEEVSDSAKCRADHDKFHNEIFQSLNKEFKSVPDLNGATGNPEEVLRDAKEHREVLEKLVKEIDVAEKKNKCPRPKSCDVSKILSQIKELLQCPMDDVTYPEEAKVEMLTLMRADLSKAHKWESFRKLSEDLGKLKERCEKRLSDIKAAAELVKSGNEKRRIAARVAKNKGVEAKELDENTVVSTTVELPREVTSMSILYKSKFEKQYGCVIDRPDGGKGAGKGSAPVPPPMRFIVHGVTEEAAACVAALRALDLSAHKVVQASGRQASAVMGAQQANARRLEEQFPGVFILSDNGKVTIYGSKKQVEACHKHVMDNLPEDKAPERAAAPVPSSATVSVDKDRARAFIGASGKNIKKVEADTNTMIKVNIPKDDDHEDAKATVRIQAKGEDRSGVEKARKIFDRFIDNLASVLVEADQEVIGRLYDGARKGKGKGKEGADANRSRFAEMREESGLTVSRKANGILLLGDKADIGKWEGILRDCLKEAGIVPVVVKLNADQAKRWTWERVEALKASTGARITYRRQGGKGSEKGGDKGGDEVAALLTIIGSAEEQEKAQEEINSSHEKWETAFRHSETINDVTSNIARALTQKGGPRNVRDIEKKHDVKISMDKNAQAIHIHGDEATVAEARKEIEAAIEAVNSAKDQASSPEAGDDAPRRQGGKGKDREKGSGKGKDREKGEGKSPAAKPRESQNADASGAAADNGGDHKWGEKQRKPRNFDANINNQELFPSLGGGGSAAAAKKKAAAPTGSAWARNEEDGSDEEAA